jgi:hypothetical protein
MSAIEHRPWIGPEYDRAGIGGQRVCIVGYSHWLGSPEADASDTTEEVVRNVITGYWQIAFFTQIRNYFGQDTQNFWNHVMFFNYLPEGIGGPDARFNPGTKAQIDRANDRFLRILAGKQPHKVMVFTRKGWRSLEGSLALPDNDALPEDLKWCELRCYKGDGQHVTAFGLRHPQGARGEPMRRAVQWILGFNKY